MRKIFIPPPYRDSCVLSKLRRRTAHTRPKVDLGNRWSPFPQNGHTATRVKPGAADKACSLWILQPILSNTFGQRHYKRCRVTEAVDHHFGRLLTVLFDPISASGIRKAQSVESITSFASREQDRVIKPVLVLSISLSGISS